MLRKFCVRLQTCSGAVGLEKAPRRAEPGAGEAVISGEVGEAVPILLDAVDAAVVGTQELAAELQIVGRVGEHEVDARLGKRRHLGDAVADEDAAGLVSRALAGHGAALSPTRVAASIV